MRHKISSTVRKSMLKDAFSFNLNWKWKRIKTESAFPTIRQRLDGKFLHWTFCDDKTKCFPLHFGVYSMSKIDWRRFYSSGIALSFTGVDYLCASTVARWGENTQTFHLSPEECPPFAFKDTFLMSLDKKKTDLTAFTFDYFINNTDESILCVCIPEAKSQYCSHLLYITA